MLRTRPLANRSDPAIRRSAGQGPAWLLAGITAVSAGMIPATSQAVPVPEDPLVRIYYDVELASYCGMVTNAVRDGFNQELSAMIHNGKFSPDVVRQARNQGLEAVYQEWQNRGLGGFRGWCRKDGAASVRRFSIETQE